MLRIIIIFCTVFFSYSQTKYQKDFDTYWTTVDTYFGYFDIQNIDWNEAKKIYQSDILKVKSDDDFIRLLEKINNELYNGHVSLNVNLASSSRLLPTGTDLWLKYIDNKFIIESVKEGSAAEKSGLEPGMEITGYNNVLIKEGIKKFLPKSAEAYTNVMYEYSANLLMAGTHNSERIINVNGSLTFKIDIVRNNETVKRVEYSRIAGNIGYVKINNSLGDYKTIRDFDKAINDLQETDGIILDLRDTPSGGNTTVARAIMGRFIAKEVPYQRHSFPYEEKLYGVKRSTVEFVSPRGGNYYKQLVVLCNRWTGSMGEGMVIGFDGINRAEIIGTEMAGLLGAIYNYTLPETGIGFQFPVEKLYHINGTPREDFKPERYIADPKEQLQKAIDIINESL